MKQILKEPLLHFFLLAMALFGLNEVVTVGQKSEIVVDRQTAQFLIAQREELELRRLTGEEQQQTIASFIEDEVLYAEAYNRGLDRNDSRMRRNLILKMRGLLTGDLADPTDDELRAYYEHNRDRFTRSASIDLDHLFFEDAGTIPAGLLDSLAAGLDTSAIGDNSTRMPRQMPGMTQPFLVGTFGSGPARKILTIQDQAWHGPIESMHGLHFLRITKHNPTVQSSYEQVAQYLRGDWLMAESRKAVDQEVTRLLENYDVVIEDYQSGIE